MSYITVVLTVIYSALTHGNSFLHECAKYYKPKNYLDLLPQLNMPYNDRLQIPNNQIFYPSHKKIQPSPVITTKVLDIKTKYVYKNPICVKYTKKQKFCQLDDYHNKKNSEKLITKENFWKNSKNVEKSVVTVDSKENEVEINQFNLKVSFDNNLESSENQQRDESRTFKNPGILTKVRTPPLSAKNINEMLIEDRLAQLETVLPEYSRRRVYETKTIYVTKTISNRRNMATLLVKNCVPLGYDICPKKGRNTNKSKKRKGGRSSKVAGEARNSRESLFYYG